MLARSRFRTRARGPGAGSGSGGGSLTALAQILALEPTALWWPTEATMTVARDGTGAAPVAGQPVGRMLDLTPNGVNAIAPTDAARPLLAADGALSFDGVDDHFALSSSIPITEEMTVVRAFGRSAAGINSVGLGYSAFNAPHATFWTASNTLISRLTSDALNFAESSSNTIIGSQVTTSQRNASIETIRLNGTQVATAEVRVVGGVLDVFGRRNTTYNNGPISFLAVFDRELTGAELELVESIAAGTNGATLA